MTHVPRSSEEFHSSTIKDDDENFQEPAIKNLKLNAEENHMKVMNILNSIVGEDYNYDGVKTPEKASKMLEPDDIRPFGGPPERTGMAQNAVYDKIIEKEYQSNFNANFNTLFPKRNSLKYLEGF
ncbi:unnamed protein product [Gordionus sp. m RMFG-2023]